jgi:excinuclease ABC subunit C
MEDRRRTITDSEQGPQHLDNDTISLEEKLESLPPKPGVYQFKSKEGRLLYVGKAVSLRNRVRQYFQKSRTPDARLDAMISKIADLEVIVTDSEIEALILEANLVKQYNPRYNVSLKDDKSYPFIVVTNEPFPRVFVTRRIVRDGSKYFGPYTDVKTMRYALKTIRDTFKVRSCNYFIDQEVIRKKKIRVCLDYHIKKCDGPCEGLVSEEKYSEMIHQVTQLLKGKTSSLVKTLEEEMERLSNEMRYEEAATVRDRIQALSVYASRQKVVDLEESDRDIIAITLEGDDACGVVFRIREGKLVGSQHFYMNNVEGRTETEVVEQFLERYYLDAQDIPREIFLPIELESAEVVARWLSEKSGEPVEIVVPKTGEKAKLIAMCRNNARFLLDELKIQKMKRSDFVPHSVSALQRDLRLPKPPRRIECFDISNIQGADAVASMVTFVDARPVKNDYRRFKIRTVVGPDDFASMREVFERRYKRLLDENGIVPDLIMVDGGKGQLSSALDVLNKLGIRNQPIIGLAKRLEEVFVPGVSEAQSIPKTSSGLRLLQRIRDEAHRFAITYHRTVRSKRTLQTELDLIKGIGKSRARELLEAFGSVQGVKFATEDQLADIVGAKVAEKIREYYAEDSGADPRSTVGGSVGASD